MTRELVSYQEKLTDVNADVVGGALWLSLADLKRVGWEIKPEGVYRDAICIPIPEKRRHDFIRGDGSTTRFNLTEFACLIEQPFVYEPSQSAWYFGPANWEWKSRLTTTAAPDFAVPDFDGKIHKLSDYRGKKVFLLCWASW